MYFIIGTACCCCCCPLFPDGYAKKQQQKSNVAMSKSLLSQQTLNETSALKSFQHSSLQQKQVGMDGSRLSPSSDPLLQGTSAAGPGTLSPSSHPMVEPIGGVIGDNCCRY